MSLIIIIYTFIPSTHCVQGILIVDLAFYFPFVSTFRFILFERLLVNCLPQLPSLLFDVERGKQLFKISRFFRFLVLPLSIPREVSEKKCMLVSTVTCLVFGQKVLCFFLHSIAFNQWVCVCSSFDWIHQQLQNTYSKVKRSPLWNSFRLCKLCEWCDYFALLLFQCKNCELYRAFCRHFLLFSVAHILFQFFFLQPFEHETINFLCHTRSISGPSANKEDKYK